jgi:hypothetical protein
VPELFGEVVEAAAGHEEERFPIGLLESVGQDGVDRSLHGRDRAQQGMSENGVQLE